MSIPFTRWPEEFARRYREKGYWQDLPLTDILTRHAASDSIAVIDGERQLSYRELNQAADNLACSLRRQGIKPGETALVQLGNVAELYITFFALLKLGVAPVLALFSHQRSELNAYASQIEPALLIADRQHALFSGMISSILSSQNIPPFAWCNCTTTAVSITCRMRLTIRLRILLPRHHLLMKWPISSFPAAPPAHRN
ncbi:AMP-binding protein [Escherichia coli]